MKRKLFCFLIDDDLDDRDIFLMALEKLKIPFKFEYESNGNDAIKKLKSYHAKFPDFIFLDMNMHVMNGKECLIELKKIPHVSEIPVIIYSTTLTEKIIYETLLLGAFDHIEKPTRLEQLCKYLKRIFQIEEMV